MSERRFRRQVSRTRQSADGRHALGFGVRVGYWPCLRGPYLQLAYGSRRLDLWHGLPSHRNHEDPTP